MQKYVRGGYTAKKLGGVNAFGRGGVSLSSDSDPGVSFPVKDMGPPEVEE